MQSMAFSERKVRRTVSAILVLAFAWHTVRRTESGLTMSFSERKVRRTVSAILVLAFAWHTVRRTESGLT